MRLVDRLEGAGLVRRTRGGREVALALTDLGNRRAQDVLALRHSVLDAAVSALDEAEQQQLHALVDRMLVASTDRERARHTCRLCDEASCVPVGCPIDFRDTPD